MPTLEWIIGVCLILLVISNIRLWSTVALLVNTQASVLRDLRTELVDGEPTALRRAANRKVA
jgi:hypothetical protein